MDVVEKLICKKLRDQGITAPKSLPGKIAKHILNGKTEPFRYKGLTGWKRQAHSHGS